MGIIGSYVMWTLPLCDSNIKNENTEDHFAEMDDYAFKSFRMVFEKSLANDSLRPVFVLAVGGSALPPGHRNRAA
jgi:hypothetical protein